MSNSGATCPHVHYMAIYYGDLIETFKILTGRKYVKYSKFFELADVTSGLIGHSLK